MRVRIQLTTSENFYKKKLRSGSSVSVINNAGCYRWKELRLGPLSSVIKNVGCYRMRVKLILFFLFTFFYSFFFYIFHFYALFAIVLQSMN